MKNLTITLIALLALYSCQSNSKKTKDKAVETVTETVYTVDEIQEKGSELIDQTVTISGTVSHVCKHGGARCFLMGSSEDVTIRVEAGNKIGSFTQEQMGNDLKITGVLKEIRIDDAYIAEMEGDSEEEEPVNKGHALGHDDEGDHNIDGGQHDKKDDKLAKLKEEVAESEKGYVSIFYLEGTISQQMN